MLRFLSVELSSRLIINDLRLTAALNVTGGFPYRPGSRSTVMARHASARKESRSASTSSNSERRQAAIGFKIRSNCLAPSIRRVS